MYAVIDGVFFMCGIVGFIWCLAKDKGIYSIIAVGWIILYPILNELIYNIFAKLGPKVVYQQQLKSRYIYRNSYNLSFCGIEKLHPFDSHKYGNIWRRLLQKGVVKSNQVILPNIAPRSLLLEKMSQIFLLKLCYSIPVCKCIEMPLCFIPQFLLRWRVLNPMLQMTEGTIKAVCVALKNKWAINIGGGFHHANVSNGGGFCVYPDITLAIHYARTRFNIQKVMIIDLDAHQGNGHQRDHLNDRNCFIVDCYNHRIYPNDTEAKQSIKRDLFVNYQMSDQQYLEQLKVINEDIKQFRPELIIYNAGTDILDGDPLGNCSISRHGIIKRDQIIFQMAVSNNTPIAMIMSGGYQYINAEVIADSLENIQKLFGK